MKVVGSAKRAAIYARLSNDREGRELGVQRQEEDCRVLAHRRGFEVVQVYVDNDISASTASTKARPEYARMLAAARDGQLDVLLAYSNSRLTRRPREFEDLIDLYTDHRVTIHTVVSGDFDLSTAAGRSTARTLSNFAIMEAEQTSERVKRAVRQRAEMGRPHGGNRPFGYRYEGERGSMRLVRDGHEERLVLEAAKRLLAGDTLYSIKRDWTERGIKTRASPKNPGGSFWRESNIRTALLNEALLGRNKAGVQAWEPLLDEVTFKRLGRLLLDPARNVGHSPGVRSSKYSMGGGLTVCGECGHRMISNRYRGVSRLRCSSSATGPEACNSVVVRHDPLEEYVFGEVMTALGENPRWGQRLAEPSPDNAREQQALEATITELTDRRQRVVDLAIDGIVDRAEAAARTSAIDGQITSANRQLGRLLGSTLAVELVGARADWREWSSSQRRTFLGLLLERVEVRKHPFGRANSLHRLKVETDDAYEERRRAWELETMGARVRLIPRG